MVATSVWRIQFEYISNHSDAEWQPRFFFIHTCSQERQKSNYISRIYIKEEQEINLYLSSMKKPQKTLSRRIPQTNSEKEVRILFFYGRIFFSSKRDWHLLYSFFTAPCISDQYHKYNKLQSSQKLACAE